MVFIVWVVEGFILGNVCLVFSIGLGVFLGFNIIIIIVNFMFELIRLVMVRLKVYGFRNVLAFFMF